MDRRGFCQSLGLTLATLGAVARPADGGQAPRDRLSRVLGLEAAEVAWLDDLTALEQRTLLASLTSGATPSPKAIDLLYKVVGRRERLFQYVGYRPLPNRLTACDGLIRE
jgi:hypothetical protein